MTTPAGGEAAEGSAAIPPPGIREVNDMLKYEQWDKIRRKIRKDDLQDLGVLLAELLGSGHGDPPARWRTYRHCVDRTGRN